MTPGAVDFDFGAGLLPHTIAAGRTFVRVHQIVHDAVWFGPAPGAPPEYRFDAPNGEFRVLYAADRLDGAFAETVLRRASRIVSRAFVEARLWTTLHCDRPLKLVMAHGEGLAWHGVDASIASSDDYGYTRGFALEVFTRFRDVDGIAYRARHNDSEICYALFDRVAAPELVDTNPRRFDDHADLADDLMRRHGAVWDLSPRPWP